MNRIFLFVLLNVCIVFSGWAIEKNPYFSTDSEAINFILGNTDDPDRFDPEQLFVSKYDTSSNLDIWRIELNCNCQDRWFYAFLLNYDNQSIIRGIGNIAGINFGSNWSPLKINNEQVSKAVVVGKILVCQKIKKLFDNNFQLATISFKKNDHESACGFSSHVLNDNYWKYYPIDNFNVSNYNDFAFYMYECKKINEAIIILTKVIESVPTRTVAYLNLGDAYYDLHNNTKAKEAYSKYIELMKKDGKENKIPQRVLERVKG